MKKASSIGDITPFIMAIVIMIIVVTIITTILASIVINTTNDNASEVATSSLELMTSFSAWYVPLLLVFILVFFTISLSLISKSSRGRA